MSSGRGPEFISTPQFEWPAPLVFPRPVGIPAEVFDVFFDLFPSRLRERMRAQYFRRARAISHGPLEDFHHFDERLGLVAGHDEKLHADAIGLGLIFAAILGLDQLTNHLSNGLTSAPAIGSRHRSRHGDALEQGILRHLLVGMLCEDMTNLMT